MSYHHFSILFVIVFAVFAMQIEVTVAKYDKAADSYEQTAKGFYSAVDEAGEVLCRYGATGVATDKSAAYQAFLYSMYASLGIMDNPAKREELLCYLPVFAVLADEGFYFFTEDEYIQEDGYGYAARNWTECMPYSYSDTDFIYRFTLDNTVYLFDRNGLINGTVHLYHTTQEELLVSPQFERLRTVRPDSFLFDGEQFGVIKQTAVITNVQEAIGYYVNNHNRIAERYGITYEFALPVMDNSVWARSIEHPGVLVMIQGYPVMTGADIYFNSYAFVGAQIYKQEPYYLTEGGWHPTYHRGGCEALTDAPEEVFLYPEYSVEECVKKGAYACESCILNGVYAPEKIYFYKTVSKKKSDI